MRKHAKYLMRGTIFTVVLLIMVNFTNRILMPKYYYTNIWPTTSGYKGFYQMQENSIDVLFLGSSMSAAQFNPQVLYNSYGIQSYNLGCEQQNVMISYYWLMEALRFQSPQVVILDTYMLFPCITLEPLNSEEGCTRKAMDCMKWSEVKWEAVHDICNYDSKQTLMSYYFPNIRYHGRWSSLNEEDFTYEEMEKHYELKGYAPLAGRWNNTEYAPFSADDSEERADMVPLMREYLDKIVELCNEEGIKLILVKTPTVRENIKQYNTVNDYAMEAGIAFWDFNEKSMYEACALNYAQDLNDDTHANIWGAEKVSEFLAEKLHDDFVISGGDCCEQWVSTNEYYQNVLQDCNLKQIKDINEYMQEIAQERYTILISVKGKGIGFLEEEIKECFRNLGLRMNYENGLSYLAVIDEGKVEEKESSEQLIFHGSMRNGFTDYQIMSAGYDAGIAESIKINNVVCSKNVYGFNVVVYSNDTMKVVDSIGYNGEIIR